MKLIGFKDYNIVIKKIVALFTYLYIYIIY